MRCGDRGPHGWIAPGELEKAGQVGARQGRQSTGWPHIPDLNSGLRIIRRNVILRYLHLLPNGFSASTTTTICLLQRGYDVIFPPIRTRERIGKSTVKQIRDGFNTCF